MSAAGNGQLNPSDTASPFNAHSFIINQILGRVRSMELVKVMAIYSSDDLAPVGFVDVMVLANQLDGASSSTPHETIFNIPFTRIQGGTNAVILDPQVDDIGWMAVADRDISSVKSTKAQANPGSFRRFDLADGVYIGGILNAVPVQYIQFRTDGIKIVDKNANTIVMDADGVKINGVLIDRSQNISNAGTYDGSGEGTFNGHTVGAHHHGGVTTGSGNTSTPTG